MPNFKDMYAYELDAQPPSYDTMIQTEQKKIKQRVKRTIMPKVRAKVAALGKAKVAEKKLVGKKIIAKAKKMDGRIKEKRRVEKGKKEIIRGIKKIGATELAKKKAAGARIKTKASVAAKMPSIQQKVKELGKSMIAKKKAKKKDYTAAEEEPNPEADDLQFRLGPNPEADTDESEDELDVDEIYFDGEMYFLSDDGRVFNPDTQERIPALEREFRKMWKRQGFKSSSEAIANKAFMRKLQTV